MRYAVITTNVQITVFCQLPKLTCTHKKTSDSVVEREVFFLLYRKLRLHKAKKIICPSAARCACLGRWTNRKRSPRYCEAVFLYNLQLIIYIFLTRTIAAVKAGTYTVSPLAVQLNSCSCNTRPLCIRYSIGWWLRFAITIMQSSCVFMRR